MSLLNQKNNPMAITKYETGGGVNHMITIQAENKIVYINSRLFMYISIPQNQKVKCSF